MDKRLFRIVVALCLKHPISVLTAIGFITIFAIFSIMYLSIDTDITTLLPERSPVSDTLQEALRTFKSFDFTFVVLEARGAGQGEILIRAAETLAPALDNPAYIYSVDYSFDSRLKSFYLEETEDRLSCLLSKSDLDTALARLSPDNLEDSMIRLTRRLQAITTPEMKRDLLEDPLDIGSLFLHRLIMSRGPIPFQLRKGYYMSQDESILLMVLRPLEPASDLKFSTELMGFLDRVREALILNNPDFNDQVRVSYIGSHPETIANTRIVRNDLLQTLIASFVMVLLLFLFVFRHRETILLVGLPLIVGIVWTLGLTQVILGHLTVATFAIGAVLIGLGIDFAIHIYNRFLEERQRGDNPSLYKALNNALIKTGEGILLGALTTAAAFYGMYFTSFPGFKELGIVAGSGILCCFTSIFLLLPILIRYVTPRKLPRQGREMISFGLPRLYEVISNYPRLVIILGLVITVYFAFQARFIRFDDQFRALKQPSSRSYSETKRRIGSHFSLPSHQIIAIVSDSTLQGALEKNDILYENLEKQTRYPILSCDSLRSILPSRKTQILSKRMIRETIGARLDNIEERLLRQGKKQRLAPAALESFINRLKRLVVSAEREDALILYEDLRQPFIIRLVQHYLVKQDFYVKQSHQYKVVTSIFPPEGQWISDVPDNFLSDLRRDVGSVEFTGVAIVASEIQKIVKRDIATVILIVMGAVFLILILYFGWLHKTFFAVLPVVCGSIWMLGTVHILGIDLNFLNVVVIPMIIGVGVDNGIHLMQRYYENGENPKSQDLKNSVVMTGRALVMTSLTTIIGFGSLAFADFQGIREMGLLSIFGISYTLFASVVFLPALLKIWGPRHRFSDLIGRDEDGEIR
ncbi:MMPL family transporter [Candidatus Sumerlaeota bacterium]|nr:MMPL family transporter [Candidatus Sumerlaeota bacterium]